MPFSGTSSRASPFFLICPCFCLIYRRRAKLEAVKISVSWIQLGVDGGRLPLDRALWSAALVSRIRKSMKQVRETASRLAFHHLSPLTIVLLYLTTGTTFPGPQYHVVTVSWNGLCHPAAALLGSSPVTIPSPWEFFIFVYASLAIYLGVCSRTPGSHWSPIVFGPSVWRGVVSVPGTPLSCQTSLLHWRHASR